MVTVILWQLADCLEQNSVNFSFIDNISMIVFNLEFKATYSMINRSCCPPLTQLVVVVVLF